jgi:hypothetical protein
MISVLYAQELISFICIAGSFQVGETNATPGVLYDCEVLLGAHSRCQRVPVTHNPTGKNHIRGRVWVTLCTHGYVNGEEVTPIGYSGCGYGN